MSESSRYATDKSAPLGPPPTHPGPPPTDGRRFLEWQGQANNFLALAATRQATGDMQEMLARYTHQVITAADGRQFGVLAESAGVAPSLWQWQVTLDGSNVPSIPGGSSLYSSPTATSAATVTGYDAETGWTGPAVTADRWVCWQVTLSAAYAITDIALASRNVGADDWYDLKGVSPDYIDRMFVPIAHIVADGAGLTVRQLVWTIPTFERVVIDGYFGLWTR